MLFARVSVQSSSHNNNNNTIEFTLAIGLARLHCGVREGDWCVVATNVSKGSKKGVGAKTARHLPDSINSISISKEQQAGGPFDASTPLFNYGLV